MSEDAELGDKIRRRLAPFIVEGRILEPAVRRTEAYDGQHSSVLVTVRPSTHNPGDIQTDVTRALADLGASVVVSVENA